MATPALGWDSWASFKVESTFGVNPLSGGVPAARDFYARLVKCPIPVDREPKVAKGMSGPGVRKHYPGRLIVQGTWTFEVHYTNIGRFLKWALGGYSFTLNGGGTGANQHTIQTGALKILPSFTMELWASGVGTNDITDNKTFNLLGCTINDLVMNFTEGEQVLVDMQIAAYDIVSNATPASITPLFATDRFALSYHLNTSGGGGGVGRALLVNTMLDTLNYRLHVNNGLTIDRFGLRKNLLQPVVGKNRVVDGSLGGELVDTKHWDLFKAITANAHQFSLVSDELIGVSGFPYRFDVICPDTLILKPNINMEDTGPVAVSYDWQARGLTGELITLVQNGDATY